MGRILTSRDVEFAVKGGSVFACGGGGWADHGRELGTTAVTVGRPELVDIADVPDDAWIATSAAIGAPGGLTDWQMLGVDYVRAVELLQENAGRTRLRFDHRTERHVEHVERLAALGALGHEGHRCGRRSARASNRRHGFARHGKFSRSDDPKRGRRPTVRRISIWNWSCAVRRPASRPCCGAPPIKPAVYRERTESDAREFRAREGRARRHLARARARRSDRNGRTGRRPCGHQGDLRYVPGRCARARHGYGEDARIYERGVRHRHDHRHRRREDVRHSRDERIHGRDRRRPAPRDLSRRHHPPSMPTGVRSAPARCAKAIGSRSSTCRKRAFRFRPACSIRRSIRSSRKRSASTSRATR